MLWYITLAIQLIQKHAAQHGYLPLDDDQLKHEILMLAGTVTYDKKRTIAAKAENLELDTCFLFLHNLMERLRKETDFSAKIAQEHKTQTHVVTIKDYRRIFVPALIVAAKINCDDAVYNDDFCEIYFLCDNSNHYSAAVKNKNCALKNNETRLRNKYEKQKNKLFAVIPPTAKDKDPNKYLRELQSEYDTARKILFKHTEKNEAYEQAVINYKEADRKFTEYENIYLEARNLAVQLKKVCNAIQALSPTLLKLNAWEVEHLSLIDYNVEPDNVDELIAALNNLCEEKQEVPKISMSEITAALFSSRMMTPFPPQTHPTQSHSDAPNANAPSPRPNR